MNRPSQGGSYVRKPDGTLERVSWTSRDPVEPPAAPSPPAARTPAPPVAPPPVTDPAPPVDPKKGEK